MKTENQQKFLLKNQVWIGGAAALLMLIGIGIVSYININRFGVDSTWDRHTAEVLASIHALHAELEDAESSTRGYVITGDRRYLESNQTAVVTVGPTLAALKTLSQDNPSQQAQIELLAPLVSQKLDCMQEQIRFRQDPRFDSTHATALAIKATQIMDESDRVLGAMELEENRLLVVRRDATEASGHRVVRLIASGILFTLTVILAAGWVIRRTLAARARTEIALSASSKLLKEGALQRAIFNSANFSSIATDARGVIQIFNVGAERMLGYTAHEVMNKITPADISDPQEVIARAQALSLELRTPITPGFEALVFKASRGIEDIYELTYVRKDGSRFPAIVSVTALRNAQDAIIGYLLIGTDNTARKQVDDALRKSEAQLHATIENISEAVVVCDLTGKLLHLNHAAMGMLGYANLDEGRRDFCELTETFELSGTDGAEWSADQWPLARILRGEKLHDVEARMRRINTEWQRVYSFGGTIAHDAAGKPLMAVVTFSDITERLQTELAAVLLAAVVESSSDAVIGQDLKSTVTSWNAAAERIFGYSAAEIVGRPITLIIPTDHQDDEAQILSHIKRGQRVEHFETERLRKDGGLIAVSVTVTPIKDSHGRIIGSTKVARDITERKRAAEVIGRLNTELEQRVAERTVQLQTANNELEAFSYSVSHDLRAPLRSIDGFSKAILEDYADKLDGTGQEHLRRVRAASQRMGQLIDDLLNLSRVSRGELRHETTDLSQIARAVCDECRASSPGRQVNVEIADGLLVDADPRLMRIVLTNLLGNAWKFTSKNPNAAIEFGCNGTNGQSEYFVRDNGAGFDMTYVGKLFGAFQRLHSDKDFPGTGIGLATIQRIIHRHGGRVHAQSKPGEGATFYFTLKHRNGVQAPALQMA